MSLTNVPFLYKVFIDRSEEKIVLGYDLYIHRQHICQHKGTVIYLFIDLFVLVCKHGETILCTALFSHGIQETENHEKLLFFMKDGRSQLLRKILKAEDDTSIKIKVYKQKENMRLDTKKLLGSSSQTSRCSASANLLTQYIFESFSKKIKSHLALSFHYR